MADTEAVFFDVDFTLIYPGPKFQAAGYRDRCAANGITVDPALFERAVAGAAHVLDSSDQLYDAELFVAYTRRIIELMGGTSPETTRVARELYAEWAEQHHFSLYDDVRDTLETLRGQGLRLGLISNSHRCLASFQQHFALDGLISVAVSSSDHGFMKPHAAIFRAALDLMGVPAVRAAMVGDSLAHDVMGARRAGMRGVLLARGSKAAVPSGTEDCPVIHTLRDLPALLA